ncbi:MAG: hypothetical protein ACKO04_03385 [Actinomycetes bacterium]
MATQQQPPQKDPAPSCPTCGTRMVRIVYGYPSPETFERSSRGEFALGGCVVTGFDATHVCEQGHRWRRRGRRTRINPSSLAGVVVPGATPTDPDPASTSEWISMADPWAELLDDLDLDDLDLDDAEDDTGNDPLAEEAAPGDAG